MTKNIITQVLSVVLVMVSGVAVGQSQIPSEETGISTLDKDVNASNVQERGFGIVTFYGKVTDLHSGEGVDGARIDTNILNNPEFAFPDGAYVMDLLAARGGANITYSKPGYYSTVLQDFWLWPPDSFIRHDVQLKKCFTCRVWGAERRKQYVRAGSEATLWLYGSQMQLLRQDVQIGQVTFNRSGENWIDSTGIGGALGPVEQTGNSQRRQLRIVARDNAYTGGVYTKYQVRVRLTDGPPDGYIIPADTLSVLVTPVLYTGVIAKFDRTRLSTATKLPLSTRGASSSEELTINSRSSEHLELDRTETVTEKIVLEGTNLDEVLLVEIISGEEVVSDIESVVLTQSADRLSIIVKALRAATPGREYRLYLVADEGHFDAGVTLAVTK